MGKNSTPSVKLEEMSAMGVRRSLNKEYRFKAAIKIFTAHKM